MHLGHHQDLAGQLKQMWQEKKRKEEQKKMLPDIQVHH
jgi:hypothetical protein